MNLKSFKPIITELSQKANLTPEELHKILVKYPDDEGKMYSKSMLLAAFQHLKLQNDTDLNERQEAVFLENVRMKKVRTLSGVTTVTVLTKPFACPGKCIFCPNDVRMPKSYISSEPGAQRAEANNFDPYNQTFNRLLALKFIGHATEKIELIVLGGTWTSYPQSYRIWFIKRCFDAMNDFRSAKSMRFLTSSRAIDYSEIDRSRIVKSESGGINYNASLSKLHSRDKVSAESAKEQATWQELFSAHAVNESAETKCVGLVIETRPDEINPESVVEIRKLGATKVQLGVQSLSDEVLNLNKRGHNTKQSAYAFSLLRIAGFKIHAHWMPNLYGSNPKKDIADFKKLFKDHSFRPDELKIYPCSLIAGTELMQLYKRGKWKPYDYDDLLQVIVECMIVVPRYCRVTRIIRDIPSQEIVDGNKFTNFRQNAEKFIASKKIRVDEIRSREIRDSQVSENSLDLKISTYTTSVSKEYFLEYVTKNDKIAGFLRLSLPKNQPFIKELVGSAIIREVHIYGESLKIGKSVAGKAQHLGLGRKLIQKAIQLSKKHGYKKLNVISSIGTKNYYKKFGFVQKGLYQVLSCDQA